MKKLLIFSLSLTLFSQSVWSQYAEDSIWKLDFHVNSLALLYVPSQRIQFGIEYHTPNNISYGLELSYGDLDLFNSAYNDYRYYDLRPTVKLYAGSSKKVTRVYIGAEIFTSFKKEVSYKGYYYTLDPSLMVRYDRAQIETLKTGFNLIAGFKVCSITNITIDMYGGFGGGVRHVNYYDMTDPEISSIFPRNNSFLYAEPSPGTDFIWTFTGGIKFGLYLERKP